MSPPSSVLKSKPGRKLTGAGHKPVKAVTSDIPVNRTARGLEGNAGKNAVVGEGIMARR
jgi:hypothetical protein